MPVRSDPALSTREEVFPVTVAADMAYGGKFAAWLVHRADSTHRADILAEADAALVAALEGRPCAVSAPARATLCSMPAVRSAFSNGTGVSWMPGHPYSLPVDSELYYLAVLSVPNLTADDIRALDPLTYTEAVGVATAVCAHPAATDDLIVDLTGRIYHRVRTSGQLVSVHLGALAVLSRFSPSANAIVTLTGLAHVTRVAFGPDQLHEVAAAVGRGGWGGAETFTTLLADRCASGEVPSRSEILTLAQVAGLA
jgi:hypothetical protein